MSETNQKGDVGEAAFVLAAVKKGYWTAKMPQDCPYDYVLDKKDGSTIKRVQIKYRAMNNSGKISFKIAQNTHSNRQTYTADKVDYFAVYVPEIEEVFLVPFDAVGDVAEVTLRCLPSKNKQTKNVRMIQSYNQW